MESFVSWCDLWIALCYFTIPVQLWSHMKLAPNEEAIIVTKTCFLSFIFFCGLVHFLRFMESYGLELSSLLQFTELATALASTGTVFIVQYYRKEFHRLLMKSTRLEATIADSEERLVALNRDNKKLSEFRSVMFASVTHEFRNPIQTIMGTAELLKYSNMKPHDRRMVDDITESCKILLTLINDMLSLSSMGSETFSLNYEKTNVVDIVLHELRKLRCVTKPRVALKYKVGEAVPKYMDTDEMRIKQIIVNLLSNSAKFTADGCISVSVSTVTEQEDLKFELEKRLATLAGEHKQTNSSRSMRFSNASNWLCITVADTGPGMANQTQLRIFEQYERGTKMKFSGTGLGLTICKDLCNRMGGKIQVVSRVGVGTVMGFVLPLTKKYDVPAKASDWTSVEHVPTSPVHDRQLVTPEINASTIQRILVVDDSGPNRTILARFLQRLGVPSITLAEDGDEAVELCKNERFDVIYMDKHMQRMSGFEAARIIKNLSPQTLVYSFSGDTVFTSYENKYFDGVLRKPCTVEDVASTLHELSKKLAV